MTIRCRVSVTGITPESRHVPYLHDLHPQIRNHSRLDPRSLASARGIGSGNGTPADDRARTARGTSRIQTVLGFRASWRAWCRRGRSGRAARGDRREDAFDSPRLRRRDGAKPSAARDRRTIRTPRRALSLSHRSWPGTFPRLRRPGPPRDVRSRRFPERSRRSAHCCKGMQTSPHILEPVPASRSSSSRHRQARSLPPKRVCHWSSVAPRCLPSRVTARPSSIVTARHSSHRRTHRILMSF